MATVTGLVLLFAFTAGGVIWLARDVNRIGVEPHGGAVDRVPGGAVRARSRLWSRPLRQGAEIRVDVDAARRAAESTAADLFSGYGVDGRVMNVTVVPPGTVRSRSPHQRPCRRRLGVAAASAEDGR